jgi:hypothetical protein
MAVEIPHERVLGLTLRDHVVQALPARRLKCQVAAGVPVAVSVQTSATRSDVSPRSSSYRPSIEPELDLRDLDTSQEE